MWTDLGSSPHTVPRVQYEDLAGVVSCFAPCRTASLQAKCCIDDRTTLISQTRFSPDVTWDCCGDAYHPAQRTEELRVLPRFIAQLASFEEAIHENSTALLGSGSLLRPAPASNTIAAPRSVDAKPMAPAAAHKKSHPQFRRVDSKKKEDPVHCTTGRTSRYEPYNLKIHRGSRFDLILSFQRIAYTNAHIIIYLS